MLAVAAVMCCSLAACGKGGGTDKDGNVIVQMSLMNSTNENPGWLAMIDAANGVLERDGEKVRIEAEIIMTDSWDQYYTKVTSNILGKIGGTIGRIAESHMPQMVNKNQIADLTEVRNALVETGEYAADAFEGVAVKDGKYYGLPSGTHIWCCITTRLFSTSITRRTPKRQWIILLATGTTLPPLRK